MDKYNSDKLYWHLVEMEKPSPPPGPPPLQSSISMSTFGREKMCAQKDKGMQTQVCMNEATMNYCFLALKMFSLSNASKRLNI